MPRSLALSIGLTTDCLKHSRFNFSSSIRIYSFIIKAILRKLEIERKTSFSIRMPFTSEKKPVLRFFISKYEQVLLVK